MRCVPVNSYQVKCMKIHNTILGRKVEFDAHLKIRHTQCDTEMCESEVSVMLKYPIVKPEIAPSQSCFMRTRGFNNNLQSDQKQPDNKVKINHDINCIDADNNKPASTTCDQTSLLNRTVNI